MDCDLKFNTVVGSDQTIHPPSGVALPEGEVEVTVRPVADESAPPLGDALSETREWLLALARKAEEVRPNLPSDLAENHDHYAHGKPQP